MERFGAASIHSSEMMQKVECGGIGQINYVWIARCQGVQCMN